MDRLSVKLNLLPVGCHLHHELLKRLIYAEDIMIFSPSVKGLQSLIDACIEFGNNNDILCNETKTVCMYILTRDDSKISTKYPSIMLDYQHC